jgi:ACS family sodium-dependent inorganic phosphate cotransporter
MMFVDRWRQRYSLVFLCFCAVFVCYIDRVNISVAIIPMAEDFGWDEGTQGLVLSFFYFGYLVTQFLGGSLADRFGGKAILAIGVIWSDAASFRSRLSRSIRPALTVQHCPARGRW